MTGSPSRAIPEELIARVQAVLRRRRTGELPEHEETLVAGEISIRRNRFDAYVGDEPASLSRKEYELLKQLAIVGRPRARTRGDLSACLGLHDGPRRPLGDVFVRKLATEARAVSPDGLVHTHFGSATGSPPSRREPR